MIVIVTGPESTGKTIISTELARYFKGIFIPEYAREYVSALDRSYVSADLEKIAEKQLLQMNDSLQKPEIPYFFDTYLIITKVWFLKVYHEYPNWIDKEIQKTKDALYLLCKPDIPWVPDKLRENGGKARIELFKDYRQELQKAKLNFCYIEGQGKDRIDCAVTQVINWKKNNNE